MHPMISHPPPHKHHTTKEYHSVLGNGHEYNYSYPRPSVSPTHLALGSSLKGGDTILNLASLLFVLEAFGGPGMHGCDVIFSERGWIHRYASISWIALA